MKIKGIRSAAVLLLTMLSLLMTACGGSGGGNSSNPAPPPTSSGGSSFTYSGPAPSDAAVQRFQQAFYNNLVNDNRCGSCHTRGGAGKTSFVDRTDINFAYSEALTLVNMENPAASKIVEKVYGGHNCWEASNAACRVQMISFIENWLNGGGNASTSVKLTAPTDRDANGADTNNDNVGDGFRSFPDVGTYGSSPLYTLVKTYCSRCHSETSSVQQQPYFASSVVATSYAAIQSKIDLNDPALSNTSFKAKSRLVVRLRDEFHNCWSASCANDAAAMQDAIRQLAQNSPLTLLDTSVYRSKAQVLNDGIVGTSGGRFELYQIALWRFLEGEGKVVSDTSGVSPAISLTVNGEEGDTGNFKWIGGGGIQFNGAVAYGTAAASKKLYDLIAPAGEYSIEAWTLPANVADEDKEIVAYSDGTDKRNFMLGQTMYNYDYYNRSSATNSRGMVGMKKFSSDPTNTPEKGALQAALQHVVLTYDAINGRKIYVDDKLVSSAYPDDLGTLANDWAQNYEIVMGNTLAQGATWKGALRMVAIHKRALNPTQIDQNFGVPPGEKRYVMFNVSQIANMPASCRGTDASNNPVSYCYIYFEVSQYDNYAYLFNKPYFISLNSDISDLTGLVIKGIHIGINGKLSPVGQAFVNVNATINTATSYVAGNEPGSGQLLADVGTVVPKLSGADADLMYLEFDRIGSNTNQTPPTTVLSFVYALDGDPAIDLGWRTFDEISASFSQLTGVSVTASTGVNFDNTTTPVKVSDVFSSLRGQLPAVEDFPAYLASHQTGVSQLAIAYCSALMQNTSLRHAFFPANNDPADFRSNWQSNLVNPMVTKFMSGGGLLSAPNSAQISSELVNLITYPGDSSRHAGICAGGACNGNDARTLNAATAACAAGLANAAIVLQ
ncbi:MAG TPA: LamG-like jellyroll fold domain-containing protein [Spongiibacteraceae bacterium]